MSVKKVSLAIINQNHQSLWKVESESKFRRENSGWEQQFDDDVGSAGEQESKRYDRQRPCGGGGVAPPATLKFACHDSPFTQVELST